MATLTVYDRTGSSVGTVELSPEDFAAEINAQLLHDAVVMYQANVRQGTKRTRNRSELAGSTRKMYRQKGTGNARAGSRRSGIRRGGGHIHALRGRDFGYRLPRKALQKATRMALAAKVRDEELVVVDELQFDAPRTKEMASLLGRLPLAGARTLAVTAGYDVNIYKSARNIPHVAVSPASDINAWQVLLPGRVVVTQAALEQLKGEQR